MRASIYASMNLTHPSILRRFQSEQQLESFVLSWMEVEDRVVARLGSVDNPSAVMLEEFRTLCTNIGVAVTDSNHGINDIVQNGLRTKMSNVISGISSALQDVMSVQLLQYKDSIRDVVKNNSSDELRDSANQLKEKIVALDTLLQANTTRVPSEIHKFQHACGDVLNLINTNTAATQDWVASMLGAKGSKVKGNMGEVVYADLLQRTFAAAVTCVGKTKESTDLMFALPGRPPLRIEIKHFAGTVPSKEVDKFHRDLRACKQHGVLVSLSTTIAAKDDFAFDLLTSETTRGSAS